MVLMHAAEFRRSDVNQDRHDNLSEVFHAVNTSPALSVRRSVRYKTTTNILVGNKLQRAKLVPMFSIAGRVTEPRRKPLSVKDNQVFHLL